MLLEQPGMAGDCQDVLLGEVVLVEHLLRQVRPVAEREVPRRDPPVGLGEAHLGVVEQGVEKRPRRVGPAQVFEPRRFEAAAQAIPTRKVESHLRPGEHPRDRSEVLEPFAAAAAGRSGCDAHPAQLVDRAHLLKPFREAFGFNEAPIRAARRCAYRGLVESKGFAEWFEQVSPIDELSRMRIASRPTRRGGGKGLEDLRAIPWVFAWSQMRLNLPGWYGLGSGLEAARLGDLRRAYASWPLFNALLDNAEMSLAKTDRRIASRYLALGDRPDLAEQVLHEYDLTKKNVLAVTGHTRLLEKHRVLSWAVELRNPYVDALSHLQLRALRALRARASSAQQRARAERLFLLTVNGVAAGLQNTG